MSDSFGHRKLSHIEPWVCVDIEINPETQDFIKGAVYYQYKGQKPALQTLDKEKAFLNALNGLARSDVTCIGHNLRRHDLKWISSRKYSTPDFKRCIDTLELYPIVHPSAQSHALEKNYKNPRTDDPMLRREEMKPHPNHPALDCETTMELLVDIFEEFKKIKLEDPVKYDAYRILLDSDGSFGKGYNQLLGTPDIKQSQYEAFENAMNGNICQNALHRTKKEPLNESRARSLAYFLSLMPTNPEAKPLPARPWVRYSHPEVLTLIRELRGTNCEDVENCDYCKRNFDPIYQMQNIFGPKFKNWRNKGQGEVTRAVMRGENVIGVLPTSGGKSLTFQLPAFINANTTGALTVVITPLISLMNDQVDTLVKKIGRDDVCQINSHLNSLERTRNMRNVRGDKRPSDEKSNPNPAHIMYMAPEQLRSLSAIRALASRGIGLLVIDEAHCMAKWGKDFRVDYRFIPELISSLCKQNGLPIPPVLCLTATARKDVLKEISDRFHSGLGLEMKILDKGHARENLEFECIEFGEGQGEEKYEKLKELVQYEYDQGHAILIFCSTRARTEELAQKLRNEGMHRVDHYHGGCESEHRTSVQDRFLRKELQIVVATNAFGMGVDKSDIRLLVHYDVPGSIENYIQEAGRAGRDDKSSKCILFYDPLDLDTQLDMRRRNHLRKHELKRIITEIRYRHKQKIKHADSNQDIVISARDLLFGKVRGSDKEKKDQEQLSSQVIFVDDKEDDLYTKVTTALGILEEGKHLSRHENRFKFIPVPMRIKIWEQIKKRIINSSIPAEVKTLLINMAEFLFNRANVNGKPVTVDIEELADSFLIPREIVPERVDQLRSLGICDRGVEYTIDWDRQTSYPSSQVKYEKRLKLLRFLIKWIKSLELDTESPDYEQEVDLMRIIQASKKIDRFSYGSSELNTDLAFLIACGLFRIARRQRGKIFINWTGDIRDVEEIVEQQNETCSILLDYFDKNQDTKGHVTSKFNYVAFERWLSNQITLFQRTPSEPVCEDGLLFMHERDVITVVGGFSLLRARMTIRPDPIRITEKYDAAYREYEAYTRSTIAQIKAMERYAKIRAKDNKKADDYISDYFNLQWDDYVKKYFNAKEQKDLSKPVRNEHYYRYFNSLTKNQLSAVQSKTNANHLIIAGPGSGKTHILVLRVFQLVKVRQIPARCIALLAYNRHAAIELRRRLKALLPRDCYDIHVHTFHGLALKLIGKDRLFELQNDENVEDIFDQLLTELIQNLESCSGDDEHAQLRWLDRLLGIEYLLVDEFQDISEKEYEVIKLLSRLKASNKENRVHVMAVGDDDQNLYEFRGSSVKWIRQYEEDFDVEKRIDLEHNFRSIPSVINVSSKFIGQNKDRLKPANWIQTTPDINKSWIKNQIGRDPDKGKIVRLKLNDIVESRIAIAEEIKYIFKKYPEIKPGEICIAHPTNSEAYLTKEILEKNGLETAVLGEHQFARRYERGVVEVIRQLEEMDQNKSTISFNELSSRITKCYVDNEIDNSWRISWDSFLDEKSIDVAPDYNMPVKQMISRIDEHLIGRAGQSVPEDKIASITLHKTKGLQFHTVFIFPPNMNTSIEELRRLYFVGLSRAKVKAFLVDWSGCDSSLWNEMTTVAPESIINREPIPAAQNKLKSISKDHLNYNREFNYFDTFKRGLGTGMNIFLVGEQSAIKSLKKNQEIQIKSGTTASGKAKIEFFDQKKVIGMLKQEAVKVLRSEIGNDMKRIIRAEVAQVILTDTEPDKRQYNNNEKMHYYIVPRIFYRKKSSQTPFKAES